VHKGHIISGAGHVGLIGALFLGPMFAAEPEPFDVTPVSTISGAAFEALLAQSNANTPTPAALPEPEALPEPTPIAQPEVVAPAPEPEAVPVLPPAPPPAPLPSEQAIDESATESTPQVAERVAPEPVAEPEPDVRIDDVTQEAVTEDSQGETVAPEQEATAEEEATTEIVTEAETPASLAPVTSRRPPSTRPAAPTVEPVEVAQTEAAEPAQDPAAEPSTEPATEQTETAAPTGPPMSVGEKDALRVSVSTCWNVGSLSSEALRTTVVVSVAVGQDKKPDTGSIRMLSFSGGSESAAAQAFQAARRAIIRCGARGFDLPDDKYGRWRDMELTFNPEGMRMK